MAAGSGSGQGGAGMVSGELVKASLTNLDKPNSQPIQFMFNPTGYSLSKNNSWSRVKVKDSNVPLLKFTSGGETSLSLELFFDTYERQEDVRDYTNKLFELTKIDPQTTDSQNENGRPPRCLFSWGRNFSFPAIIKSISIQFLLFLSDGTPVRARVSLGLEEAEDQDERSPQNPTSQGRLGQKIHIVKPGDTIDRIAWQHYKDSKAWRFLADINGIDNPMKLRAGQTLAIQPMES
jgi:hypothetical protein